MDLFFHCGYKYTAHYQHIKAVQATVLVNITALAALAAQHCLYTAYKIGNAYLSVAVDIAGCIDDNGSRLSGHSGGGSL